MAESHSTNHDHKHHQHHQHHDEHILDPVVEGNDYVEIVESRLDVQALTNQVSSPKAGAIATFLGVTRDHHAGKKVLKLEYEAYEPMAISEMQKICKTIRSKWNVIHVLLYHRIGEVPITETSVFVGVSSIHRKDSLEACHFAIDEIKASVPVWKKEFYENGNVWKENQEYRDKHKC